MDKSRKWRGITVLAVLIASVFYTLPTFIDNLPSWWTSKKVSLGLDLKGGIHLVMEVDLNVVLENSLGQRAEELRSSLVESSISAVKVAKGEGLIIEAEFPDQAALDAAILLISEKFTTLNVSQEAGLRLTLAPTAEELDYLKKITSAQALETIRNRVDMFGVAEPDIRPQGENRIVIQLPGMDDPNRAVELIGKTALLEFKLVDNTRTAEWALANGIPAGMEVLYGREIGADGKEVKVPYLVRRTPLMTGEGLVDARAGFTGQLGSLKFPLFLTAKVLANLSGSPANTLIA